MFIRSDVRSQMFAGFSRFRRRGPGSLPGSIRCLLLPSIVRVSFDAGARRDDIRRDAVHIRAGPVRFGCSERLLASWPAITVRAGFARTGRMVGWLNGYVLVEWPRDRARAPCPCPCPCPCKLRAATVVPCRVRGKACGLRLASETSESDAVVGSMTTQLGSAIAFLVAPGWMRRCLVCALNCTRVG